MAFYLSPLVDVNEIDLSTTIPAVATSIGVSVLRNTYKGPENKRVLISSEDDLINLFGYPIDRVTLNDGTVVGTTACYEDMLSALGFLKFGNKLYATRVLPTDATFAGLTIASDGTSDEFLKNAGTGLTFTYVDAGAPGVVETGEIVIDNAGTGYVVGNVVDLDDGAVGAGAQVTIDTVGPAGNVLTFTVSAGGTGYVDATLTTTIDTANVDTGFPTGTMADLPSGDVDDFGTDVSVTTAGDTAWMIASSRGSWGNDVRIGFITKADQDGVRSGSIVSAGDDPYNRYADIDSPLTDDKEFLVIVEVKPQGKTTYELKEVFNVSTDEQAIDDQGRTKYVENVINQQSGYLRFALATNAINVDWPATIDGDAYYSLLAGGEGATGVVSQGDVDLAYDLYENPEEIDVNIFIDANKDVGTKRHLVEICEARKDCMAVVDPPKELVLNNKGFEAQNLVDWRLGQGTAKGIDFTTDGFNQNTSYASVYGNWIEVYDKWNKKYRWIPAAGHVAGIYAKTDDVADPWWAPAGLNRAVLTGIRRLAFNPVQGKRDIMYVNGINPIVSFAGQGKVIWGQKTLLDKSSAFNRVNVRRLFIVLEKAISTAAKYFLFEPNDAATRVLLVNMIEPFLRDVKARRGIYDFKVICDDSNNTPERVDRNELWCDILIKPTRTAEFIVLNFVALKTGASFEEAAAAI